MKSRNIYLIVGLIILAFIAVFSSGKYGLWLIFILLGLTFAITLGIIIKDLIQLKRQPRANSRSITIVKLVSKFILLFLCSGTFLYILTFLTIQADTSYTDNPAFFSNTELFFRSLICSFDLFLLDIDSNIIDRIDTHTVLKTWIFIQAILSALCTAIIFLSLIIARISALWKLNIKTKISNDKSHLYLFFGLNNITEILAKDVIKADSKAVVILVDTADIGDSNKDAFDNILSYIGHKSSSFSFVDRLGGVMAVANMEFEKVSVDNAKNDTDVLRQMGLKRIGKLITDLDNSKIQSPELRVFFLSGNEEKNIADLMTIAKDETLQSLNKNKVKTILYCHARKSGPNSFIEELALGKGLQVNIIDSSYLAVEALKLDVTNHPVNFVELSQNNPGAVASKFSSLIVGFGEVGRDALRFLYEFGAFLDENATPENSSRSNFECVAVDSDMDNLKGGFQVSAPSLFTSHSGVELLNMSSNDSEFYLSVLNDERCKGLNYIVLATGDDNENINLALRIFRFIRSKGNPMTNLRILVRCSGNSKKELMSKLAKFYNTLQNPTNNKDIIRIFGDPEMVFTFDLIINDKIEKEAVQFFNRYQQQSGSHVTWEGRRQKLTAFPLTLDNLQKLIRQENQDIENALHGDTKMYILVNSLGKDYDWNSFLQRYFLPDGEPDQKGSGDSITYPRLNKIENKLILNLAMLEHLRWMAAHELLGYTYCSDEIKRCDETMKHHNCLVPWQDLDKVSEDGATDYKIYDFYTVDTTISINQTSLKTLK